MAKAQAAARASAPQGNIRKHGAWSAETAEKEFEESQQASGSANYFKPKTGKNVLRFLPPAEGRDSPFVVVHQHYIEVPGGQKAASFNCPRMHKAGRCPACEKAQELRDTGNPADYERAGDFLPRRRVFANVIDRNDPERGVLIFPMGKTIHEQLLSIRKNAEAGGDFTDPSEDGFDIIVEKTGEKLKTEYKVLTARRSSPLGNDEWLDQMHDLEKQARVEPLEEIYKKLGEEPPAAPARSGGRVSTGRAAPQGKGRRTAEDDAEDDE
jgi:hypothetical protein